MTPRDVDRRLDWKAAALLGLISSTFSTIVSTLSAFRIGRDAAVDWMVVAAIPIRDAALQSEPSWSVVAAGIAFHQWADFSWALVFFGLLGRWTRRLGPWTLLALALPWAMLTSSLEWFVLVPVLPFMQPVFTLEQPYWLGLLVHLFSASMYPLFPWLRDRVGALRPSPHRRFGLVWGALSLAGMVALSGLAVLGASGRELPWTGHDPSYDQSWIRKMAAHHAQGVALASIAADNADDERLRALARLMAASQRAEIDALSHWWRSWFGGVLPPATAQEHRDMPGMLDPSRISALRDTARPDFDRTFVALMSEHHRGAILMADEALHRASDLRLRTMAHVIRHAQRGEIALMNGAEPGFATVGLAVSAMLAPEGRAAAGPPAPHAAH
ncbi:DUF305 domain-containing protein [Rhodoplanes roseus]|uniref:DUF305 domain-containing protein n=1 Tax=Rhodoplanes roseus TaxID=29409 RepID=A0A327KY27_9BRAD|nr:DUF305 domain-containing protein [Rhodoplanes roseus]RAI43790.1 DUF305 domain-containing protein [Rhodoplanes roseus]